MERKGMEGHQEWRGTPPWPETPRRTAAPTSRPWGTSLERSLSPRRGVRTHGPRGAGAIPVRNAPASGSKAVDPKHGGARVPRSASRLRRSMKGGNPQNQPRLGGPRPPKRHTRGRPSWTGPFAAEGVAPPLADHEPAGLLLADAAIVAPGPSGPSTPFPPLPLSLFGAQGGEGPEGPEAGPEKDPGGKALRSRAPGTRSSKGNANVHSKTHPPPVPKPTLTRPTPWPLGPLSPFPPSGPEGGKGGRGRERGPLGAPVPEGFDPSRLRPRGPREGGRQGPGQGRKAGSPKGARADARDTPGTAIPNQKTTPSKTPPKWGVDPPDFDP